LGRADPTSLPSMLTLTLSEKLLHPQIADCRPGLFARWMTISDASMVGSRSVGACCGRIADDEVFVGGGGGAGVAGGGGPAAERSTTSSDAPRSTISTKSLTNVGGGER